MDSHGVAFTKMQGTGNDFIVFDNRAYGFTETELSICAAAWCPRRFGVGGDGLLALDDPETTAAAYRMHYVNADGSRATMCGNGARCLFRFARASGFEDEMLAFDTDAGLYWATRVHNGHDQVRLFVPQVTDLRADFDLDRHIPDAIKALHFVEAGTEHLVALVEDVQAVPVPEWGERLRSDPAVMPTGANVNFVEVDAAEAVRLRTYEKGVEGETLSCGTGVLATAAIVNRMAQTRTDEAVRVETPGGKLLVGTARTGRGHEHYLEGPAKKVFRGRVSRPGELQEH